MSFWNKKYVLQSLQTGGVQKSMTTVMLLFLRINMADT